MIELTHDEITAAIGFYLDARGASADLGTLEFKIGEDGLRAELEGERAEDSWSLSKRALGCQDVALATCTRASCDFVSGEELGHGRPCLWVSGTSVTAVHPVEWPAELKSQHSFTEEQLKKISQYLGRSEAQTAADILGGAGEVLDRGEALSGALKKRR